MEACLGSVEMSKEDQYQGELPSELELAWREREGRACQEEGTVPGKALRSERAGADLTGRV